MVTEILPERGERRIRIRSVGRPDAGAMRLRTTPPIRLTDDLGMSLVRLLSIAVEVSTSCSVEAGAGPDLPPAYRLWPSHRSTLFSSGREVDARFYVSPKGIVRALDDAFPVGTTLVVETAGSPDDGAKERRRAARVATRFVMTKCASITSKYGHDREIWLHASYAGSSKRPLPLSNAVPSASREGVSHHGDRSPGLGERAERSGRR